MRPITPLPTSACPSGPLRGRLRVPGDKSISHRAVIMGAMAEGKTTITNLLEGEDILSTIDVMRTLGGEIERTDAGWSVIGVGPAGLNQPDAPLDCGNAGTGARLIMGAVAGYPIRATFIGDESLSGRPMNRVLNPLQEMGAKTQAEPGGLLPVTIEGGGLQAIRYAPPKASAQVKSCILLAGLGASGDTHVIEHTPTRAHTELMLKAFGAEVNAETTADGDDISLTGPAQLKATHIDVPGDPSSAAFATVAALIIPGSDITLEGVMRNPRRDALYNALAEMGADLAWENPREAGGETVADLRVRHSALTGITVDPARAPDMIDEYPILAVAAAFAEGTTVMEGIHELRVKESDRISATVALLKGNGVAVEELENGMRITGGAVKGVGTATTHHDHRIAMSALILGLASETGSAVDDSSSIATSYPDFFEQLSALGGQFA